MMLDMVTTAKNLASRRIEYGAAFRNRPDMVHFHPARFAAPLAPPTPFVQDSPAECSPHFGPSRGVGRPAKICVRQWGLLESVPRGVVCLDMKHHAAS